MNRHLTSILSATIANKHRSAFVYCQGRAALSEKSPSMANGTSKGVSHASDFNKQALIDIVQSELFLSR